MLDCHVFFICALLPFSLTPVRDESSASRILPTSVPQRIRLHALRIAHSTVRTYVSLRVHAVSCPDSTSDPHSTDAPPLLATVKRSGGGRAAVGGRRAADRVPDKRPCRAGNEGARGATGGSLAAIKDVAGGRGRAGGSPSRSMYASTFVAVRC